MEMSKGVSLLRTAQSLLTGRTIDLLNVVTVVEAILIADLWCSVQKLVEW